MPTENQPITLDSLMEQVQVFASSWSLVGGPFDNGDQMGQAKQEKADLRQMLEQFARQNVLATGKPYDGLVAEQQALASGKEFCGACGEGCASCRHREENPPIGIDSEGGSHD